MMVMPFFAANVDNLTSTLKFCQKVEKMHGTELNLLSLEDPQR